MYNPRKQHRRTPTVVVWTDGHKTVGGELRACTVQAVDQEICQLQAPAGIICVLLLH